jgi:hypothetical protein
VEPGPASDLFGEAPASGDATRSQGGASGGTMAPTPRATGGRPAGDRATVGPGSDAGVGRGASATDAPGAPSLRSGAGAGHLSGSASQLPRGTAPAHGGRCTAPDLDPDVHLSERQPGAPLEDRLFGRRTADVTVDTDCR